MTAAVATAELLPDRHGGGIDKRAIALASESATIDDVMHVFGCSRATVYSARRAFSLGPRERGRSSRPLVRGRGRNLHSDVLNRPASMPAINHAAIAEGRTVFLGQVAQPGEGMVLKEGVNNAKTGGRILKGDWSGLPIFTLTLEERVTCPPRCEHWRSCMGNRMRWAVRYQAGPELERALARDVAALARKHPDGFSVRLHVLGDFYSPEYVSLWRALLKEHPGLHLFGFTRRHDADDPIARGVLALAADEPQRFRVRFSNAPSPLPATVSIETPRQAPPDAIICPAQTNKTATCSTCALCWSSAKRIAFLRH